jgi:hypothetical protein
MSLLDPRFPPTRRPLGETLAELALGLLDIGATGPARATGLTLRLPLELRFEPGREELIGDLPLYRRATAFDAPPAQVTITLAEVTT